MWPASQISESIIPLPAKVKQRYQVARFLELEDLNVAHAPHAVIALANFTIPDFPFAVLAYLHSSHIEKKGWPLIVCPETRVAMFTPSSGQK